jgi:hypothetical protein
MGSSKVETLERWGQVPLGEVIARILEQEETWIIQVSEEQEITIQPQIRLKPLPTLEGYVPKEWKDAVYE